jgi:hypothetical protein
MEFLSLFFHRFRIHWLLGAGSWLDVVMGLLAISNDSAYLQTADHLS